MIKKDVTISVRLDADTIAKLDRLATAKGQARTATIRQAIAAHLRDRPQTTRKLREASPLKNQTDDSASIESQLAELECLVRDLQTFAYRFFEHQERLNLWVESTIKDITNRH